MASQSKSPEASEYPRFWDWDEDGKSVEGMFLRANVGYTANGPRPFVVLDVDGDERTIWLLHDVLRNQFAREVHRRPNKAIDVGETIRIHQLEPRESQTNAGRAYTNYRTEFPQGPATTQVDVFGLPPEASPPPEFEDAAVGGGVLDADIPFA